MVVWLVISSCRNDEDILRILDQVHASDEKVVDRILVVDSEGTGMVPEVLKNSGWNDVDYRSYDYNLGSGANLCERLRIAAAGDADYAYAINHDGYFDAKVITSLLRAAETVDNLGAAYPLSYFTNLSLYNLTGTRELPLSAKFVPSPPHAPLLDVFWGSSNGALYSMDPLRRGIVPWDTMWMAWEDLEYGWRLSDYGYRQVIVCDAVFRDNYEYTPTWFGRTMNKPAWRTYYYMRNLILAIRRSRNRPLYYLIAAYRFLLECGLIVLSKENKWRRLRLLCAGASDGIRGIEGRRQLLDQSIV
jgi:GT2 family glycosyltransferase